MPKMGESIMEATIIRWSKAPGDTIRADETVLEIATDKVDSEVPSPTAGTLAELKFKEGDVVPVGAVIAIIETSVSVAASPAPAATSAPAAPTPPQREPLPEVQRAIAAPAPIPVAASIPTYQPQLTSAVASYSNGGGNSGGNGASAGRFYSPLVLNIARQERIGMDELERIPGSGSEGRVTKKDILDYVSARSGGVVMSPASAPLTVAYAPAPAPIQYAPPVSLTPPIEAPAEARVTEVAPAAPAPSAAPKKKPISINGEYDIVEMDRMRRMIAENMVASKHTAPHVTSFVEADVTSIVQWREANKDAFEKKYKQKLTFTPLFAWALARALRDYPMVNIAVDGTNILVRKDINLGMAVALPSGNLIVPTIRHADRLNLPGLATTINELTAKARTGKLAPDDVTDGSYTFSNVGTFGNVMGTPIILQPQCAVMALGAIRKKPAVLETPQGDVIAVRHMMFLSHSYDHRVIDGMLGGTFVRRVADYLEGWDPEAEV
jgi:2-oxoglutarate dehydrogenase E2 component (dihydrolipoamide succinyltransferase)